MKKENTTPKTRIDKIFKPISTATYTLWTVAFALYVMRASISIFATEEKPQTLYDTLSTIIGAIMVPAVIGTALLVIYLMYAFFFQKRPAPKEPTTTRQKTQPITKTNTDPYSHIPDGKDTDTDESLFQNPNN